MTTSRRDLFKIGTALVAASGLSTAWAAEKNSGFDVCSVDWGGARNSDLLSR